MSVINLPKSLGGTTLCAFLLGWPWVTQIDWPFGSVAFREFREDTQLLPGNQCSWESYRWHIANALLCPPSKKHWANPSWQWELTIWTYLICVLRSKNIYQWGFSMTQLDQRLLHIDMISNISFCSHPKHVSNPYRHTICHLPQWIST